MKIVVLGAGALGSIIAGHLAKSGENVTLLARGERAAYLKKNGITITGLARFNTPCAITTDPRQLYEADALIVTVKTYDMEAALSSVAHAKFSYVTSVQNGVMANEQLASVFGSANTIGASAGFSGEVLPGGEVRFTANGGFDVGELPKGSSQRTRELSDALQKSGVNSKAIDDVLSLQWSKFAMWVGFTAIGVLTRLETYKFASDPGCALTCVRIVREAASIAAKMDIPIRDSGPIPVKAMVDGSEEEAVSATMGLGTRFETQAPQHRMSVLQGLEQGRRLEIDETLGFAVTEARRLSVPAPTLELCYGLLGGINRYL
jgi:2-dehydropantoate 2-reductase